MKSVVGFFLMLYLSACLAQITFTREWVKGKRSTTANAGVFPKEGHSVCGNLVSAVEYLIELEKMRRVECAECCHSAPASAFPEIQRSPSDFLTFVRELPPQDQEQQQVERGVPQQPRRNQ